ncbi:MAG: hypothetical protein NTV01_15625 [Bacteroidia bacterium]|nr:hypothetical protein [Bacteroidia bacterium]
MPTLDFPLILSDSSRSLMDYTAAMVGDDTRLFKEVLDLAYQEKSPLCMRAARVADLCCERNPELIRPYLVTMVKDLPGLKDMAVKRVFMHILIRHSWVEDDVAMGKLVDTLFKWLSDDTQAVAIKAYAMAILENITKLLPDLKGEMIVVLEEAIPLWGSYALQGGGIRMLKRLRKRNARQDKSA